MIGGQIGAVKPEYRGVFIRAASVIEDMPKWLYETRLKRGLSLRQVATACGVSYTAIARLEQGRDDPSWFTNRECRTRVAIQVLRWLGSAE